MDHGFLQSLYLNQTKRWIWLLGIAFAVVMAVQYCELPFSSGISSLLSDAKVSFLRTSYFPDGDSKTTTLNGSKDSNSSDPNPIHETKTDHSMTPPSTKDKSSSENSSGENTKSTSENVTLINNVSSLTNLSTVKKRPKKDTLPVLSISKMNELLLKSRSSPSVPAQSSSRVDQQLLKAKMQIEDAPIMNNDTGLYAPIYRNVSMFRRSYEIMERVLKVYIYKEGEKPIFHDSILEGIYACEGWFLKLMEASKQFVTEDPEQAHLFFLPFSSRLLELTLYVPHSHSRDNLIQFMKNYTEMLISKYPFWNRTTGSDHFLAGCHDWAPAETRGRLLNTIRGLCNADIKVGFDIGKDVSLPTTYVRSSKNPLQDMGGEPPSQRPILAFFAGYMHGYVRPVLLSHWGNDTDMRIFARMPQVKGNKNYIQHMKTSKYCICARGFAVHSPRIVESLFYECVPVIISDNYVPPLFEVLNWESFAVFVLEKDIPDLKNILLSISEDQYLEMHERVRRVREHFLWHAEPVKYDLFHMILHSVWYNRIFRMNSSG